MGVLLNLTDEYFKVIERDEDRISLPSVKERSFTDKNGKFHKKGYYIDENDSKKARTILQNLIEKAVDIRGFECDLNDIDVSNLKDISYAFGYINDNKFNADVSGWDTSNVENMEGCFYISKKFDGDLSKWNVSKVTNMRNMFYGCSSFKGKGLEKWNINTDENISINMVQMFGHCLDFNADISEWDVSRVTNMSAMFLCCGNFNKDLSKWKVSNVNNMASMFEGCTLFNCDLSGWDVKNVENHSNFCLNSGISKKSFFPKFTSI